MNRMTNSLTRQCLWLDARWEFADSKNFIRDRDVLQSMQILIFGLENAAMHSLI